MGKYNPQADIAAILKYTEQSDADPAARFALISTLSRYQEQLKMLQDLNATINQHGSMLSVKDGYGREVMIENPAVKTYAKVSAQADATVRKLLQIYRSIK